MFVTNKTHLNSWFSKSVLRYCHPFPHNCLFTLQHTIFFTFTKYLIDGITEQQNHCVCSTHDPAQASPPLNPVPNCHICTSSKHLQAWWLMTETKWVREIKSSQSKLNVKLCLVCMAFIIALTLFLTQHRISRESQLKEMSGKLRKNNIRWKFSQLLA